MNAVEKNIKTINVGINKTIFEKRLSLGLTRKDAARLLGIKIAHLAIIERGYIKISLKMQERFKKAYEVDDSFFFDNFSYPIVINEKIYEPINTNTIFDKIGQSKLFRYICLGIAVIFAGISIYGATLISNTMGNPTRYFSQDILEVRDYIVTNGKPSTQKQQIIDLDDVKSPSHFIGISDEENYFISINALDNPQFIKLLFFDSLSFDFEENGDIVSYYFYSRFIGEQKIRVHYLFNDVTFDKEGNYIHTPRCTITADVKYNSDTLQFFYSYTIVAKLTHGQGNVMLHFGDKEFAEFTETFENLFPLFENKCGSLFTKELLGTSMTYNDFKISFDESCAYLSSDIIMSMCLTFISLLLAIILLGLFILSCIERNSIQNKLLKYVDDVEEDKAIPSITVEKEPGKERVPRNTWMDLFVPEFFVRLLSLGLLFASSLATYFLFINVVKNDVVGITASVSSKELVSNLSVIAIMLLYFVKLDIYQNKKSAVGICTFYLILGLLYYLALVVIYYMLVGTSDSLASITNAIFDVLPGNIVWGVVVFNLITIIMFAPVKDKFNADKKKIIKFRLTALIPFSYLVASCIVFFGIKAGGWQMPYAVSSLFFYKAPMITVFAILYCAGVFLFRWLSFKKFGMTNGLIFIKSNKYNYIRNATAALIILGIGIFDLVCLFCWKDNPFGFGSNYLMLAAIPFLIFYHPHLGKRNGLWDAIFNVLYCIAYIIGIVLVIIAILVLLATL